MKHNPRDPLVGGSLSWMGDKRETSVDVVIAVIGIILFITLLIFVMTRPPTLPEISFTCNPGDTYTTKECP